MNNWNNFEINETDVREAMLTAYALGELEGDDAAEFERRMQSDPALRRAVDDVRATASQLRRELAAEPALGLTAQQRSRIERRTVAHREADQQPRLIFRRRIFWTAAGLAAAACIAIGVALPYFFDRATEGDRMAISSRERAAQAPGHSAGLPDDDRAESSRKRNAKELGVLMDQAAAVPAPSGGATTGTGQSADELQVMAGLLERDAATSGGTRGLRNAPGELAMQAPAAIEERSAGAGGTGPAADPRRPQSSPNMAAPAGPAAQPTAPPPAERDRTGMLAEKPADDRDAAHRQLELGEREQANDEEFMRIVENEFMRTIGNAALSTLSTDVDTASYSNIRRYLNSGQLPPKDAVRIEEMLNYFTYPGYEPATGEHPFNATLEVSAAPWQPEHRLVRIGLRAKDIDLNMRPATSLVFLIDVSGSMSDGNKLPLVKESLKLLVEKLNADDRLAIVTYAGNAGVVLESTYVTPQNRAQVVAAIDGLSAGGSTNGAGGICIAYDTATRNFIKGGVNRVILCTDGDFNVGVSSDAELVRLIEHERETGVFLSVLGFGTGNFKDAKMEQLSNAGNGNFAYIDSIDEAKRTLVERMGGTLIAVAKDVKFQVEFNPAKVGAYRLIGYEDRLLAAADFNNDRKDAGEIGAGHTVTALYEIIPAGAEDAVLARLGEADIDELEYQQPAANQPGAATAREAGGADGSGTPAPAAEDARDAAMTKRVVSDNLLTVKVRYKQPDGDESTLLRFPLRDEDKSLAAASPDFRFAAAVAEFGMLLRDSQFKGNASFESVLDLAAPAVGDDPDRREFLELVRRAAALR